MRFLLSSFLFLTTLVSAQESPPTVLPIDPLWESDAFRKTVTGSYGIDSQIEPRITTDEEFYLDAAAAAMAEKDRGKAIRTLTDSSLLERSPAMLFMLGTFLFEEDRREESAARLEEALALFPNFRDAHRNLAIVHIRDEEWEKAKKHLVRAMELGSREAVTLGLLGYCHAVAGHSQAALDAYRIASLSQPEEKQWKLGQAQALAQLGDSNRANRIYQEILEHEPGDWNLWLNQADGWVALGRPLEAMANLEAARRAGALPPEGILSLGHLFLENELLPLAVARYREAFESEETVPNERKIEALEYLTQREHYPEAAGLLEILPATGMTNLGDENLEGRYQRVSSLVEIETGDPERGAARLEAWLERNPIDGEALLLLGRHRESEGKREIAEMLFEQATGVPETAAAAHRAWGNLLLSERDYEGTIVQWEKSIALEPSLLLESSLEAVRELIE